MLSGLIASSKAYHIEKSDIDVLIVSLIVFSDDLLAVSAQVSRRYCIGGHCE